jgi:hypothetical protein
MKLLVTGSAGHLGEALMRTLPLADHEPFGLDIKESPFTHRVGSIVDRGLVRECLLGMDGVVHTATLHKPHVATHARQDFVDTNITGTLNLLEEACDARIGTFLFTSTTSVFGRALTPSRGEPAAWITEDVVPRPKNIYGITKLAAENLCELFHRYYGLPCLILRTSRFETFIAPVHSRSWLEKVALAPDVIRAISNSDHEASSSLIRALLLREAFGEISADLAKSLAPERTHPKIFGAGDSPVAWTMVWRHYSSLAETVVSQLEGIVPDSKRASEALSTHGEMLRLLRDMSEATTSLLKRTDEIWEGQTAMMDYTSEIGRAVKQVLDAVERSPTSIEAALRDLLGPLFDRLGKPARKFLIAAEFDFSRRPDDLDFSAVIILLTKTFESELKRAFGEFKQAIEDVGRSIDVWTRFDRYTLGTCLKVFSRGRGDLAPLFENKGFSYDQICEAVEKVNGRSEAKHQRENARQDAGTFRELFVRAPSILSVLFPTGRST